MLSLPNMLTLSRIVAVPVLVAFLWVPTPWRSTIAFAIYAAICVTDYFDGWLARRWSAVSRLGAFLDPIADKIMVTAVLVMLVALGTISGLHVLPAMAILLREIMVSGLREFLSGAQVSLPVSYLAKWKTTCQMLALGFLIMVTGLPDRPWVALTGLLFLWGAALLTLLSGWIYLRTGLKHMD